MANKMRFIIIEYRRVSQRYVLLQKRKTCKKERKFLINCRLLRTDGYPYVVAVFQIEFQFISMLCLDLLAKPTIAPSMVYSVNKFFFADYNSCL